jgi:ferredoxin
MREERFPPSTGDSCLGMLSAEHLVALSAWGKPPCIDASACNGCDAGGMYQHLAARLRKTEEESGLPLGNRIRLIPDAKEIDFRQESLDRRGFFRSFRRLAVQGMTAALLRPSPERKAMSYMDKYLPTRRAMLLAALASLPPETAQGVRDAFSFSIVFGTSCDGCLGCARVCPSAALSDSGTCGSEPSIPRFDPERCMGCGLCAEFCLSEAIRMDPAG